ncbi:50S ribosomal protein L29 [Candidatus Bathyarchaeota archaeon]|nr:50S ribosomal protein L29 [Candidatus Bathyarchaeota archaeon]
MWGKNKDELTKQLGELKTELGQLRIQKIVSSGAKLNKMYVHRRAPTPAPLNSHQSGRAAEGQTSWKERRTMGY